MSVRTVFNNTGYSLEDLERLPTLFTVKNMWRERDVVVKRHPTKADHLISIGYWFDGSNVAVCDEEAELWQRELEELPWRTHFVQE